MGQLVDHETRIMSHAEGAECAEASGVLVFGPRITRMVTNLFFVNG